MEGEFMSLSSSFNLRRFALCVVVLLPTAVMPITSSVSVRATPLMDGQVDTNCRALHAGIRAEFVRRDPPYTQPPFVMVSFVLLNDGDTPAEASPGSWKLVIDGKELNDSAMIFGNGPGPVNGWRTLNPGETAEFGKELEAIEYFPDGRDHKISWHGTGFQSPTITVKIPAKRD